MVRTTIPKKTKSVFRDFAHLLIISVDYLLMTVIPRRFEGWMIDRLCYCVLLLQRSRVEALAQAMASKGCKCPPSGDFVGPARDHYRMRVEGFWGRVRGMSRHGWAPMVRMEGLQELQKARARGRGVILWRMSFCSSPIAKAALAQAGIPLVHLSNENHGASSANPFILNTLCRLHRRAEDHFLKERITIPLSGSLGYMKTLMERLASGGVVSIFGEYKARKNVSVLFFDGEAEFATGAASLAYKSGAVLLTMHVMREARLHYRVVIGKPIDLERDLERKDFVRQAIVEFAVRLQKAIQNHPSSWLNWSSL